jgi:hypothetical protein
MNIEQANTIPMSEILQKLGHTPTKQNSKEAWYLSPFRTEKTASFHITFSNNCWYDFGEAKGGDVVGFVCEYLKAQNVCNTVSDALRWIRNMQGFTPLISTVDTAQCHKRDPNLVLKDTKPIESKGLIKYLQSRGIPLKLAQLHLKEAIVQNKQTKKCIYALGLLNEEGGYELRNPFFKGCVGRKDISFIRGNGLKPKAIHLFEGFFDYLTVITHQSNRMLEGDVLILNSIACIEKAIGYIKSFDYQTAYTWMDNDTKGKEATQFLDEFFKTENGLTHFAQNHIYAPHKDVNAWHMHKLKLAE